MKRELNVLLLCASFIGGLASFIVGEVLLGYGEGHIHETLLMGLYFGLFALIVGLACLVAEMISPDLNGTAWRYRYLGDSWKLLFPASFILLFLAGSLLQFIYGLSFGREVAPPRDYAMVIDISGSMAQNDPNRQSLQAAQNLIQQMDPDKRAAIVLFNDEPKLLHPMIQLIDEQAKRNLTSSIVSAPNPDKGTDIGKALMFTSELLKDQRQSDRRAAVILISDGVSDIDIDNVLKPYQDSDTEIHTIGFKGGDLLLKKIASRTDGKFYRVGEAQQLTQVFTEIYRNDNKRYLVGERTGIQANSAAYKIMRIGFITLLGSLLGLMLGIIFDNKHLALRFSSGGAVGGLLAGFLLEFGLQETIVPAGFRGGADICMAIVLAFSTVAVPVQQNTINSSTFRYNETRNNTDQFTKKGKDSSSNGFR
ncbi:vWA domain-containing protein [Paenibacillus thalictri]|uniref:VWA domain-containing protein n=1 Tax=Paenibacillus thalictri TaxID=2527873 RepID=A0A4Q9E0B8_9BACL|nr:VWA domain-containing protein [Paenibacillus thalictri]TBL80981.1 VWA domain-containing protein [Paenibacillus thalictri]